MTDPTTHSGRKAEARAGSTAERGSFLTLAVELPEEPQPVVPDQQAREREAAEIDQRVPGPLRSAPRALIRKLVDVLAARPALHQVAHRQSVSRFAASARSCGRSEMLHHYPVATRSA